jgi:isochorismate hydrolase
MKELYFTTAKVLQKSQDMLATMYEQRARHDIIFHPECSALLVLDMQDYFLMESSHAFIPSASAVIPNIQTLIQAFVKHLRPVIFTRHINTERDAGMMFRWWKSLIRPEAPDCDVTASLDTSQSRIIDKTQYDAFFETNLDELLHFDRVKEVVITGVMTHLCCETTARSAFMRGYEVFFVIDGTATFNEAFHRATLLNLSHGFAIPVLTNELIEKIH